MRFEKKPIPLLICMYSPLRHLWHLPNYPSGSWASQRPPTSSSLTKNIQSGSTQVTNTKQQDFPEDDEDLVILDQNNLPAADDFDINYGLLEPQETVVIRAYSNDADDRMLAELQPRFIVMYEPCMEFARRVEVNYFISGPKLVFPKCSTGTGLS